MNIELLPTDRRSNYLTDLAERIAVAHAAAEAAKGTALVAARKGIEHALAAGALLNEAKSLVPHGQWLPWSAENCPTVSERMARHYMRLARNRPELETQNGNVSDLSLRQAVKLLTLAEDDEEHDEPDSDEWWTPPDIIEAVRDVLGNIDLDPASCVEAQQTVKADQLFHEGKRWTSSRVARPNLHQSAFFRSGRVGGQAGSGVQIRSSIGGDFTSQ